MGCPSGDRTDGVLRGSVGVGVLRALSDFWNRAGDLGDVFVAVNDRIGVNRPLAGEGRRTEEEPFRTPKGFRGEGGAVVGGD